MKKVVLRLPLLCLVALFLAVSGCSETTVEPETDAGPLRASGLSASLVSPEANGDYVVGVQSNAFADISAAVVNAGGAVVRSHPEAGILIVTDLSARVAASLAKARGVRAMAADVMIDHPAGPMPAAAAVDPDSHDPTQAFFYQLGFQWDMEIIQADDAWNAGASAEGVTVAILDTGIDATHPDLAGLVDEARSTAFVQNANPSIPVWGDDHYHGTHVAGTVASNGLGTAGVAPHATLMAVKVCGVLRNCPFSAIVSGIIFAAENDADVANLSVSGFIGRRFEGGGQLNALLNQVMNYANRMGVVVVAAAGNDGVDLQHVGRNYRAGSVINTPCQSGNGMCVSATNVYDEPTAYTNYGTNAISVAAPGGDNGVPYLVLAPCSTQSVYLPEVAGFSCGPTSYLWVSGTSMAAPHVAGAAALVVGQLGDNAGRVKARIQDTADDLGPVDADPYYGKGRLNVMNAWSN